MDIPEAINVKVGVSGTLVFKDADGNVVAEKPFTSQVEMNEQQEASDDDQRSE